MNYKRFILKIALCFPVIRDIAVKYWYKRNCNHPIWGAVPFSNDIDKALETFRNEGGADAKLRNDIIYCYLKYASSPSEFFLLGFDKAGIKRSSMLTNAHKDKVLIRKSGLEILAPLRDKYTFYKTLSSYFKRDVICLRDRKEEDMLRAFISKNSNFIVKPLKGKCAEGVDIIEGVLPNADLSLMLSKIIDKYPDGCICESLIRQSSEMAKWNSSSVNTVRMYTFLTSSGIKHMTPVFRTGRKGSITDNAATGGIFANIAYESGILVTDGHDEAGNTYEFHPDSGYRFLGYHMPAWNELLDIVCEAHHKLGIHRYIGWDWAYTENGWVLIEGDWARFINEYADLKGRKKEFDKLMTYSFIDKMYE